MQRKTLAAIAAVGIAVAIAIPTIASGNARRIAGTLAGLQRAETPYIAQLLGANELTGTTPTGDPDGVGAASVSFDTSVDPLNDEVCFDLSYSGIVAPTLAHIHRGAVGAAGPVVIDFGAPGATAHTGCVQAPIALVAEIEGNPAGFYVNVHNADFPAGALRGQLAKGPSPAGTIHFLPTPLRAYDSRDAAGPKIAGFETRTISLATAKDLAGVSHVAVPPGATAALVTLTITESVEPGGYLKLYTADSPEPPTSNINWVGPNVTVAVGTQVNVDTTGKVKVTAGPYPTHFLIDVVGYLY